MNTLSNLLKAGLVFYAIFGFISQAKLVTKQQVGNTFTVYASIK